MLTSICSKIFRMTYRQSSTVGRQPNKFYFMPNIICYDIASDKLRTKIANKLLAFGFVRFQKSVFISGDLPEHLMDKLKLWLKNNRPKMPKNSDKVLLLSITEQQLQKLLLLGDITDEMDEVIHPKSTLFI